MSYDLQAEFAKDTNKLFLSKRYKNTKAEIMIPGGHYDYPMALKPNHVTMMMEAGKLVFPFIAAELGCTNVHCADYRIEYRCVPIPGDDYEPDVDRDFYFLIAKEK